MKRVLMPTTTSGDWWVIMHPLSVKDRQFRRARAIHVLTMLAQHLTPKKARDTFGYSLALENKLFGVRHHLREARAAFGRVGDPIYVGSHVNDYDDYQALICSLEAYFNAIYSALELAARLNRQFDSKLPMGFHDQSKRYPLFSFESWPWLGRFYDLRTEFAHFGTSLPEIREASLVVGFTRPGKLDAFTKGEHHKVPLAEVFGFAVQLFDMLDNWAKERIRQMDPKAQVDTVADTGPSRRPKPHRPTIREFVSSVLSDKMFEEQDPEDHEG